MKAESCGAIGKLNPSKAHPLLETCKGRNQKAFTNSLIFYPQAEVKPKVLFQKHCILHANLFKFPTEYLARVLKISSVLQQQVNIPHVQALER